MFYLVFETPGEQNWTVAVVVVAFKSLSRFCEIRRYDRTAEWRKGMIELHFTATLISRSAAVGDQVLILLKVTTATISPAVSQHGQSGSNREKFL